MYSFSNNTHPNAISIPIKWNHLRVISAEKFAAAKTSHKLFARFKFVDIFCSAEAIHY